MPSLFEDIRDGVRDGVNLIVQKTGEWTQKGKLNIDLIGIRREIEQLFSELGGRTYELITKDSGADVAADSEVIQHVNRLQELEKKLDAKKMEITQVHTAGGEKK
jgi:hypothetical protein